MRRVAILLVLGGLSSALASTSALSQDLARAQEPTKNQMTFMSEGGQGIVLNVSKDAGFLILEGPPHHVELVREALVESGVSSDTIIARPVEPQRARGDQQEL